MKKRKKKINNLTFRIASLKDVKIFFNWRNDRLVRKNSRRKKKIKFSDHYNWYVKKLKSKKTLFFIFQLKNTPIGQVRLDCINKKILISYSVDKKYRKKGFGKFILKKVEKKSKRYFNNNRLYSVIDRNNIPSIKVFTELNYKCYYKKKYLYYKKKLA